MSSRILALLALLGGATAFNVGAPALRSVNAAVTRSAPLPVMQTEEIVEEEEAMSEEEYEAELALEEQAKQDALGGKAVQEEENLLAPGEAERIKAEIKKRAPWMDIDPEAIARAKRDRENRKKEQAMKSVDAMNIDPQAAEMNAASGLKSKVLGEDEVELRWETADEVGNEGFIVQRRPGGQSDFVTIATYDKFAPLKTKGPGGGQYVYLDSESGLRPGSWVYRIVDCDTSGDKSAMCQKLVEIESKDEQTQTIVVGALIATLALVFVGAGIFIDPIQTTQAGRGF